MIKYATQQAHETYNQLDVILANESEIDVSRVSDRMVESLPTEVKRRCLEVTDLLRALGFNDDPVLRLRRAAKMYIQLNPGKV